MIYGLMMDEKSFGIISDNLKWLESERRNQNDILAGVLAEACEIIKKDAGHPSGEELLNLFSDIKDNSLKSARFASLCSLLFDGERSTLGGTLDIKSAVYMKSRTADEAFDAFSESLGELSASYGSNFSAICEEVYYERADACIMPLESTSDGLFMSFRNLLMKYELMIAAVCRIPTEDDGFLSTALLTSGKCDMNGNMYEIYFREMTSESLISLTLAADALNVKISRINSTVSKYSGVYDHYVCFEVPPRRAAAFEFCINTLFPSNLIIGKYKILHR